MKSLVFILPLCFLCICGKKEEPSKKSSVSEKPTENPVIKNAYDTKDSDFNKVFDSPNLSSANIKDLDRENKAKQDNENGLIIKSEPINESTHIKSRWQSKIR